MHIFVTGATGVLGKAVVPSLLADGHMVYALSRSEANTEVLQRLGAKPVPADLLDAHALVRVLAGCRAEAILHLATSIPSTMQVGRRSSWQENDRIRREGTRVLVEAALAAGTVSTFIYPSYAFVYRDSGDRWIDAETAPIQPAVNLSSTLDAEAEVVRFAGNERRGISLRMGSFYGPELSSWQLLRYARRGIAVLPGALDAYLPQIWVPDAASAIIAALAQPVPSGIYDLVDDEPLTRGEVFAAMAQAVGRKRLWQLPAVLLRMVTGVVYDIVSRSLRVSNRRFKAVSNWNPSVPNARVGWSLLGEKSRRGLLTLRL
jgi:nucleoside-diphosphate-sugar epimerase